MKKLVLSLLLLGFVFTLHAQKFTEENSNSQSYSSRNNVLTYHLADLIFNNFTLSYECLLKDGSMGVEIPLSIGYDDYNNSYGFKSKFYTGATLNLYPTGQGKWRYFFGPAIRLGTAKYNDGYYDQDFEYVDNSKSNTFYFKLLINNGVMFSPVSSFSLSAILHLGIRYTPGLEIGGGKVHTTGDFSFNMSYRF